MRSFLLILLLFSCVLAAPASLFATKPSDDPFYQPPAGFESTAPGTILRNRTITNELRSVILPVQVKNTWQLLVRSTDSHGNPNAIVTTLIEPFNSDPSKLVSHQIAEDSPSPDCANSYALERGAPPLSTINSQAEMVLIQAYLEEGYFVNTPDYEGPKAAFTAGRQSGHATLDSIRGVLKSGLSGIHSDAKVMLFGYSGGSLASGWAAALQPKYAPELKSNLLGAALGGFVTNVTATAEAIEGGPFAGLTAGSLSGLSNEYPQVKALVEKVVRPDKKDKLELAANLCLIPNILSFFGTKFFTGSEPLITIGWELFNNNITTPVLKENTLGLLEKSDEVPQIPLFIFESKFDEIVPFSQPLRTYNNWCQLGVPSIEFNVDAINGHVTELITGSPSAVAWIKKIFDGGSAVQGCHRFDRVSNLLIPGTSYGLYKALEAEVLSVLQQGLGPTFPLGDL